MFQKPRSKRDPSLVTTVEDTDQCYTCEYFCKGVSCPLLECLAVGLTQLTQDVTVKNCGFYVEFKRVLGLVPELKPEPRKKERSKKDETSTRRK